MRVHYYYHISKTGGTTVVDFFKHILKNLSGVNYIIYNKNVNNTKKKVPNEVQQPCEILETWKEESCQSVLWRTGKNYTLWSYGIRP